jgi:hypothetical protein
MNPQKNIIVVGNDKYADQFDYQKIKNSSQNPDLVGVNRMFYIYNPDYLFFHDLDVLREMIDYPINFNEYNLISTDWLKQGLENKSTLLQNKVHELEQSGILNVYKRTVHKFPDSVTNAIRIASNYLYPDYDLHFYVVAVSLKWDNTRSHFWRGKYNTYNNKHRKWYEARFKNMFRNFQALKKEKYNIYNCTPNSRLNDLFKFKRIEKFYK